MMYAPYLTFLFIVPTLTQIGPSIFDFPRQAVQAPLDLQNAFYFTFIPRQALESMVMVPNIWDMHR